MFWPTTVVSGVPQSVCASGSILGQMLFLIFINDRPQSTFNSSLLPVTNDTKWFHQKHSPLDRDLLQQDINNISDWSKLWNLAFNKSKYVHLSFLENKDVILSNYHISTHKMTTKKILSRSNNILSADLLWSDH